MHEINFTQQKMCYTLRANNNMLYTHACFLPSASYCFITYQISSVQVFSEFICCERGSPCVIYMPCAASVRVSLFCAVSEERCSIECDLCDANTAVSGAPPKVYIISSSVCNNKSPFVVTQCGRVT